MDPLILSRIQSLRPSHPLFPRTALSVVRRPAQPAFLNITVYVLFRGRSMESH